MTRSMLTVLVLGVLAWIATPDQAQANACDTGTFKGAFDGEVVVPQNWNCKERQQFWFTDQGSQIIPYAWFLHLEQANSTARFSDPANMDRYRYLPQRPTGLNPDGLPIGFTRGTAKANKPYQAISNQWLGLTCAACHTGQVEFGGKKYLIDGAPTMGDFETLFRDLVEAMKATLNDDAKFERFAKAVIKHNSEPENDGTGNVGELRDQLREITTIRDEWNQRNEGKSDYGHARLDAIGAIFNETSATALEEDDNVTTAGAPVSYPFIWDTPQHDRVQWNGSVENAGPGALGRNVGEVLGVFGYLEFNPNRLLLKGHITSVNVANLGKLEKLMWQLWSPLWRDTSLPPIDDELAEEGRQVFADLKCGRCHKPIDRTDPNREIIAQMSPVAAPNDPMAVNTDETMALNFLTKRAKAAQLTGRFERYLPLKPDLFGILERNKTPQAKILGYSVIGAITRLLVDDTFDAVDALTAGKREQVKARWRTAIRLLRQNRDVSARLRLYARLLRELERTDILANQQELERSGQRKCFPRRGNPIPCYKARPLNGIWATAPFLHNGSVRTLRQLLLPSSKRQKTFNVGSREFDPETIGFKDEGAFRLDTSKDGNSNKGHEGPAYGTDVLANDENKLNALLEYLKTL